ncbi:NAD(P)-binding protein [Cystobasidium minutum MCA 4210]|uniref:NAD(P)-binding protein n=1 Tax=Cystobasidium minutum MCA 4210 TaxID=1397322 RepID=UPI0034CD3C25|eukprot:jgi/Rhomi1/58050/CE58049_223
MFLKLLCSFVLVLLCSYTYALSKRLGRSRFQPDKRRSTPFPTDEELLRSSEHWAEIDVLQDPGVEQPTNKRYLITGACGSFGVWLVQILHRRGEREIYCLDMAPLPPSIQGLEGTHYLRCDISSADDVKRAFEKARPDVVFHIAANIRFWERAHFTYKYSKAVNVDGTRNIIEALQAAPNTSEKLLLYCSSAAVQLPSPLLMRLGYNFVDYASSYTLSDDRPIPDHHRAEHDYAVSKTEADRLVRAANGQQGLRTGVLRPGMTICSPTDQVFGAVMRTTPNPFFGENCINSQDLAAAFLLYEKALRERSEEVAGEAFLVTGDPDLWTWQEQMQTLQLFAKHDLKIIPIHPLPLYFVAHFVECFCFIRYYGLLLAYSLLGTAEPAPHPKWMEPLRLHHLQPAMWNTLCSDVEIDDSRARKILGYRNRFSNADTLRWIAETNEKLPSNSKKRPTAQAAAPVVTQLNGFADLLKEE